MAVRLPLILSQPARRDASATDLVENLVAAALLVPGLDANLIGDIGTIQAGSTDHVCLLGHSRDLVLASFLELAEAQRAWHGLGQSGHFVDLAQDEAGIRAALQGAASARKVYYYQLAIGQPVDLLLGQCRKLLSAQQLSLVTLQWRPGAGGSGPGNNAALSTPPAKARATPAPSPGPSFSSPPYSSPPYSSPPQPAALRQPRPQSPFLPASDSEVDQYEEWSALDKLVDDLDAMDL